jgi:aryl-alcohol dehydrogenase-like predicted oxidoreductase
VETLSTSQTYSNPISSSHNQIYGTPKGNSETIVGKWLATKKRQDFVIATKCRYAMSSSPHDSGASRKHILASIDESLARLQTSYIDLYQIHGIFYIFSANALGFDKETPLEETLAALNELIRNGKVRYIGVSNYRGYQLQKAWGIAKELGIEGKKIFLLRVTDNSGYICLQVQYSLMCREVEWEVLEAARSLGMGIIPWSPLKVIKVTNRYQ